MLSVIKMLQISNLHLPVGADEEALQKKAAKQLCISPSALHNLHIVRQSIDARRKDQIHLVYTVQVDVEDETLTLRRAKGQVTPVQRAEYHFPTVVRQSSYRPVIVGMGPAGLFCALYLAQAGIPCIILERGKCVDERTQDVERFWQTGQLNTSSNVQFGEGGAGTFSDGKLTTGTHDGRINTVLETLVSHGAPPDVCWSHKPHIGTDVLRSVVRRIREELISLGCEVRFGHQLTGLHSDGSRLTNITVTSPEGTYELSTDTAVLAIGHSARDTFSVLHTSGLPMAQKPFAIGVRIEQSQQMISQAQFGPAWDQLPPSDYKLSCHLPTGRSVYTFCVCPGGQVVAAASEAGRLVTNGMSCRARDGVNINGGFLVGVTPADFGGDDPLAGVRFQQHWEEAAFQAGGGDFRAPAQLVGDFLRDRTSSNCGNIIPTYLPGVTWGNLSQCLPNYVIQSLQSALPLFDRKVHGFACDDAVLTGVETRSSSPVRIQRDESLQSTLQGVYPCGEGCGYAGGIVSAAVDGIRVAEAIASNPNR